MTKTKTTTASKAQIEWMKSFIGRCDKVLDKRTGTTAAQRKATREQSKRDFFTTITSSN